MIAQVKCSYADLYIEDNLTDGFLKMKTKFTSKQTIGTLSGKYKTYRGKDYLQLATVNGLKQTNYFWVKKVAVNITPEESESENDMQFRPAEKKSVNNKSSLLLGLATLLLLD